MKNKLVVKVSSDILEGCFLLAYAYYLAHKYDKGLLVLWGKNANCLYDYEDIFEPQMFKDIQFQVIDLKYSEIWPKHGLWKKIQTYLKKESNNREEKYYKRNCNYVYRDKKTLKENNGPIFDSNLLKEQKDFYLDFDCVRNTEVDASIISFKKKYYEIAEAFMNGENYVGIEIPRGKNKSSVMMSKIDFYANRIRKVLEDAPDTKFYCCTEDATIFEILFKLFPDRIVTYGNQTIKRGTKEGLKETIVDIVCLSKCKYIIGSEGYGLLASKIGGIPISIVGSDKNEIDKLTKEGSFVRFGNELYCPQGNKMELFQDSIENFPFTKRILECRDCRRPCYLKCNEEMYFDINENVKELTGTFDYYFVYND